MTRTTADANFSKMMGLEELSRCDLERLADAWYAGAIEREHEPVSWQCNTCVIRDHESVSSPTCLGRSEFDAALIRVDSVCCRAHADQGKVTDGTTSSRGESPTDLDTSDRDTTDGGPGG